ncbi:hypothetical protein D3C78_1574790 [compost metagenome]
MLPSSVTTSDKAMIVVAIGRSVKRSRPRQTRPKIPCPASPAWSLAIAMRAALALTPRYDNATGINSNLVKMSTATPMLVVRARSRITGMSMMTSTAKPTILVNSAVSPVRNRRRNV